MLVIDDDPHMLMGLNSLLSRNGFRSVTCKDSVSSIKLSEEVHPDLIVCDVMMPLLDGFEVKEMLSSNPATCDIPFLFLSARTSQTDKLEGLGKGADDYITKPFDPRELVARIEAIFRRQEKERLAAEREMDHHIQQIQAEISHNISHELRTPITQILMSLDMVLREKYSDPDELKWFVETALSQSYRLNGLIDDLTFLDRYDMGQSIGLRQKVDLQNDFTNVISIRRELYKEKNLRVDIHVADTVCVHAPHREFKQAVSQLTDNGLKFAPPMTTVLIDLAPNGHGGCIFTVTDYGSGVPSDLHEKVFERFYQASQGDTRQHGGLGVGLTIARMIARSLGGDVTILPTEHGCRVQMILPPAALEMP